MRYLRVDCADQSCRAKCGAGEKLLSVACYGNPSGAASANAQLIDDPERPGEKMAECILGGSGERHADLVCLAP